MCVCDLTELCVCVCGGVASAMGWALGRPREAGACAVVDESGTGLSLAAVCPGDAQRLELTPSSHIRNPTRDLCLDVVAAEDCGMWGELTGACQVGGWKLTAATCDPSRTQQRWALIDS